MDENLHREHRERVREEFLAHNFDENTPPHKILELLLFYSIPRKNTNNIAHKLIKRFGSISGVFEASVEELQEVEGIGEKSAILLKLMLPVIKSYKKYKQPIKRQIENIDEIGEFLSNKYLGFNKEVFAITSFNNNGNILGFDIIEEGSINNVNISTRKIVEAVITRKAACVVISHNHPGGWATPSETDIETTIRLCDALGNLGVRVLDHIILCDDDYVSLAISKDFKHLFNC